MKLKVQYMASDATAIVFGQDSAAKPSSLFGDSGSLKTRKILSFLFLMSIVSVASQVAGAQTSTAVTLSVTPTNAVTGAVLSMTATVSATGSPVSVGTVTFNDMFNGVVESLGTVQVQSAAGTPGVAVLATEVGGVGSHSISATFNATTTYGQSVSAAQPVTFTLPYGSATALTALGGGGTYSLTATLSAFGPLPPGGTVTFTDTTANTTIGTVTLDPTKVTTGFTPAHLYPITTTSPWNTFATGATAIGDFNGDGRPDFAVPTQLGAVAIMLGNGDGTFQPGPSLPAVSPFGAVVGDFNGDGKQDIAITNVGPGAGATNSIAVYLGNGDGTFQAPTSYAVAAPGAFYQLLAAGDFNGDGFEDLVATDHTNNAIVVVLGNGDGTFQAAKTYSTGSLPWNIVVGDINNDGILDIITADDGDNLVTVLLGNGDGSFKQGNYPTGSLASTGSVVLADFNGDGFLDIATTEEPANMVYVLLGNGDGTFQPKKAYPMQTGPYYLTVGDFNRDGKKDIISANLEGQSVGVLLGNGDGTFQAATTYPSGAFTVYSTVGDFNGDDQTDVVSVTANGLQVFLAGNAEIATFSPFSVKDCGTHSLLASYGGDSNYSTSSSPIASISQNGLATSLTESHTPSQIVFGQPTTLSATLAPFSTGTFSSDGATVTFLDGSTVLGTGVLANGVATLNVPSFSTGNHNLSTSYTGACSTLTGSTSVPLTTTVVKATPVITWPAPAAITYGTALSGTQLAATASLPGTFVYTPAAGVVPPAGNDMLSVTFTPNDSADYATSTQTTPLVVQQSSLTVTADNISRVYGTANPKFSGSVTGAQNGDIFSETFTTAATTISAPGSYPIVPIATGTNIAQYSQAATQGMLTITQAAATISATASAATVQPGLDETITVNVASATTGTPTGMVNILDNGNLLGTATLSNGAAMYSTTNLLLGSHVITVTYSGDTNFSPNTASAASGAITVTVVALDFTMQAKGAATATGFYGNSAQFTFHVAPTSGQFPGSVMFSAAGSTSIGNTYTFSPATLASASGPTDVTMTVSIPNLSAANRPAETSKKVATVAFGFFLVPLMLFRQVRHSGNKLAKSVGLSILMLSLMGSGLWLTGCGGGSKPAASTAATITTDALIVTAASGSVQHTAMVTLQLQNAQ